MLQKHGRILFACCLAGTLSLSGTPAHAADYSACGTLKNGFGPFDFRVIAPGNREVVETHHFTPQVEALRAGETAPIAGDLDYTLRAMPNHPRALMAMAKLSVKAKSDRPSGSHYPVECYFDRALRFTPDDPMPRLIYAIYLTDHKRSLDAKVQLDEAERLRGDQSNSDFDYNLGLLYYTVGDYDKSASAAKRAYALGAPLPGLQNKLKAVNRSIQ